jgi:uncharacterized membrane protein
MSRQSEQVWSMLLEAGVTEGESPETTKLESPWYVKVLLAFSGWLAAVFLLGFFGLGLEFVFDNGAAAFVLGGMMIGGAFAVLRIPQNEFVEHLALAASLAGQALVVFAIIKAADGDEKVAATLVALLQAALAVVMPNFVHRVFSSFGAALAFDMALTLWGLPFVATGAVMLLGAWCWLNEFRYPHQMGKMRAVGYGLVLALILLKGTALFGHKTMAWQFGRNQPALWARPWVGEVLIGVVVLYVVWLLLQRYDHRISDRISITLLLGTLLLCVVSMKAQGISVGMVIILLGFAGSNRVLQGLGVLSLLFYISTYYYMLDATLLAKSYYLLSVGLFLLVLRWAMSIVVPVEKEVKHV